MSYSDKEPLINIKENNNDDNNIKSQSTFTNFKYKKESFLLLFIFTLLIVNSVVYNIILPNVFIDYVQYHYPNLSPSDQQSKASYFKSYSDSIPNIFLFLLGPIAGILSDKYGRKPVILVSGLSLVLDMLSCYVTIITHNLWPFYIFHSIGGVSNIISSAVLSYIADITNDEERSLLYSFTGISSGFGVVVGPLIYIGTSHISQNAQHLPLFLSIGLTSFASILVLFLKESLTIAKETNKIQKVEKSTWNPFKAMKKVFSNSYIGLLTVLFLSINYTAQDVLSTYYYYCELMYNWNSTMNSLYMGGVGLCIIIWSAIVIPQLLKKFSQRKLISMGFFISIVAHIGYSLSFKQYIYIIAGVLGSYVPNNMYMIQSLISSATPPELQGTILSGIQSCGSIAGFLGALAANDIYSYSISKKSPIYYPGAIYVINGCIVLLTFIGSLIIWRIHKNPNKKEDCESQESNVIN